MIIKMQHLDLLCVAADKENTLTKLRDLGVVHLDLASAQGADVAAAKGEAADAEKAVRAILKARADLKLAGAKSTRTSLTVAEVLSLVDDIDRKKADAEALKREIAVYAPFGDFDPALAQKLLDKVDNLTGVNGDKLFEIAKRCRLGLVEKDGRLCIDEELLLNT